MPQWTLRSNRSEKELRRRSTIDAQSLFKKPVHASKSVQLLAPSAEATHHDHPPGRVSWSADRPPSPPVQRHTPQTKRFSMLRFRHASDPQLSTRAKEDAAGPAPPVPVVDAAAYHRNSSPKDKDGAGAGAPPAIITTAPTMEVQPIITSDGAVDAPSRPTRKQSKLQQFARRRMSFDPTIAEIPQERKSMEKKRADTKKRHPFSSLRGGNPTTGPDQPGRASTSMLRHGALSNDTPDAASSSSLNVPGRPRMSESSRSDGSSVDHSPVTPSNDHVRRFPFPRFTRNRASLFPLPVKIPHPPSTNDGHNSASTALSNGVTPSTPEQSPVDLEQHETHEGSPPLTAVRQPAILPNGLTEHHHNGIITPLGSPSHATLVASSISFVAPGTTLLRQGSTNSVRSSRSSPARPRLGLRGRSSTMGSARRPSEDTPPTPPFVASGRNSTSTAGRSSLSTIFGFSHRFRQGSEPHSPRHGSPAHGHPAGTPWSHSQNISREALSIPKREEGEAPGRYLERLEQVADRSIIASILSKADDAYMISVLRSYMRKFAFFGDPIDMAVRKLLMEVELPKETQQIDRVLQGFADRYHECNPGIFLSSDKAYFISFSIVILHTDFFNKNNKRKMQRPDYIRNSTCEGVPDDVLGCVYDNIVYTPFIHFEDAFDMKEVASKRAGKKAKVVKSMHDSNKKAIREPIDPYYLIIENKLDVLRPPIKEVMDLEDPYNYVGPNQVLDGDLLHKTFTRYGVIQIVSARSRPEAFMNEATIDNPDEARAGVVEMPVTKVGILWRKDPKRKTARSPWQEWGVILTRSSLSFFKNDSWAKNLMNQYETHQRQGHGGPVVFKPPLQDFKPDHVIPTDNAVALLDGNYKKHKNAFSIFGKGGVEEIFLADNEADMSDWMAKINYSAAFETAGVRTRGLVGGLYEGQRNRGIRRLDSSHSTTSVQTATGEVTIQSGRIDTQLAQEIVVARQEALQRKINDIKERLLGARKNLENQERDARHLQIMAPVQPKSRDQVVLAAGRMVSKLKWIRVERWRMQCHADILTIDLEDERSHAADAADKKRRGETSSSPPPPVPVISSSKLAKISGLAKLNSKASSIMGSGPRSPISPSTSLRPDTKSSGATEWGEDVFKTPPEHSRQGSPGVPSSQWELPLLSFQSSNPIFPGNARRGSVLGSSSVMSNPSPRLVPLVHRPSMSSTIGDSGRTGSTISETGSRHSTPLPQEDGATPADADIAKLPAAQMSSTSLDGPSTSTPPPPSKLHIEMGQDTPGAASESEEEDPRTPTHANANTTGSPESRSKIRRSLHRTLRDSQGATPPTGSRHSHHRRSGKGKDSTSTIVSGDGEDGDSEVLTRTSGSFVVHGKKASVVAFGAEWADMSAEERLSKMRKLESSEDAKRAVGGSISEDGHYEGSDGASARRSSLAPTVTKLGVLSQRQVSSQTVFHAPLGTAPSTPSKEGSISTSDEKEKESESEAEPSAVADAVAEAEADIKPIVNSARADAMTETEAETKPIVNGA